MTGDDIIGAGAEPVPEAVEAASPPPPPLPVYAATGWRLLAFATDYAFMQGVVYGQMRQMRLAGHGPFALAHRWGLLLVAYLVLVVLPEAVTGRSLGKALLGLQVRRSWNQAPPTRAGALRILWRDTGGRLMACLPAFAGYWLAHRDPQHCAWTDLASGTVVLKTRAVRPGAVVAASLCLALGFGADGLALRRKAELDRLNPQILAASGDTVRIAAQIRAVQHRTVKDTAGLQREMSDLEPLLDRYDAATARYVTAVSWGLSHSLYDPPEIPRMRTMLAVMRQRQLQNGALREETQVVLAAQGSSPAERTALRRLDAEINDRGRRAATLLAGIQLDAAGKALPPGRRPDDRNRKPAKTIPPRAGNGG